MLDYRIETFLVVCREMNYTKAAEILNITQPNVSQHIRWLEELYNQKLFEYKGRKLILTRAGELIKKAALAMEHEEKLLRQQMRELDSTEKTLLFGVTRSVNEGEMKHDISRLMQTWEGSRIRFIVDNTHQLLEDLNSLILDFAVVEGNFDKSYYDYIVLRRERFIPVCRKGYSFRKEVHILEDLFEEAIIVRETGSGSREIFENALQSRNYGLNSFASVMEIGDIGVIKMMLEAERGITFVYETAVHEEIENGILEEIPIEDFDICHDFAMIWLKTRHFFYHFKDIAYRLMSDNVPKKEVVTDSEL